MFERFMRWLGWVPASDLDMMLDNYDELQKYSNDYYDMWAATNVQLTEANNYLNQLRQYAHVRTIEANIAAGKARKVKA